MRVTVPAAALIVDEPEVRRRHGLAGRSATPTGAEIQATMLGETQLRRRGVSRHQLSGAVAVQPRATAGFLVTGDFTLHGTTRRISVPVVAQISGGTLHATGAFDINQSDFGITPVSLFLGAVRNQDRVRVAFDLVATP